MAAALPYPTDQQFSESSRHSVLDESQKSSFAYRGASSLSDAIRISAGNNEGVIGTDLKNSPPSSKAQETIIHRDIALQSILSKDGAEDKDNHSYKFGTIKHGTEEDRSSSLADMLGERKLASTSELPVSSFAVVVPLRRD